MCWPPPSTTVYCRKEWWGSLNISLNGKDQYNFTSMMQTSRTICTNGQPASIRSSYANLPTPDNESSVFRGHYNDGRIELVLDLKGRGVTYSFIISCKGHYILLYGRPWFRWRLTYSRYQIQDVVRWCVLAVSALYRYCNLWSKSWNSEHIVINISAGLYSPPFLMPQWQDLKKIAHFYKILTILNVTIILNRVATGLENLGKLWNVIFKEKSGNSWSSKYFRS